MNLRARGQSRLAWFDRFIVPRETPLAPSRWHQHIAQRRLSRLDHLRPHRLNWEALYQTVVFTSAVVGPSRSRAPTRTRGKRRSSKARRPSATAGSSWAR